MLRYPKASGKRSRKRHGKSIMQEKDGTCYLCMKLHGNFRVHGWLHKHHAFGGSRRQVSEAEGFFVWLCPEHHETGPEAVHRERAVMRLVQQDVQREYEKTHSREAFMALIGKNYL